MGLQRSERWHPPRPRWGLAECRRLQLPVAISEQTFGVRGNSSRQWPELGSVFVIRLRTACHYDCRPPPHPGHTPKSRRGPTIACLSSVLAAPQDQGVSDTERARMRTEYRQRAAATTVCNKSFGIVLFRRSEGTHLIANDHEPVLCASDGDVCSAPVRKEPDVPTAVGPHCRKHNDSLLSTLEPID